AGPRYRRLMSSHCDLQTATAPVDGTFTKAFQFMKGDSKGACTHFSARPIPRLSRSRKSYPWMFLSLASLRDRAEAMTGKGQDEGSPYRHHHISSRTLGSLPDRQHFPYPVTHMMAS
ncbi:MAG: hypothetical protein OXC91_01090, partial [Rhodobacteraceae bacterium]|nr:hypothetical protein [Paracoccaceae bacterium]